MGTLSFKLDYVVKVATPVITQHKADGTVVLSDKGFKIKVGAVEYPLTSSSFSNKGKKIVYSRNRDKHGNYIKLIRDKEYLSELPNNLYIPFKPGLLAKGRIININGFDHFAIVACYSKSSPDEYKKAIKELDKINADK